jgi:hypothetical protein
MQFEKFMKIKKHGPLRGKENPPGVSVFRLLITPSRVTTFSTTVHLMIYYHDTRLPI